MKSKLAIFLLLSVFMTANAFAASLFSQYDGKTVKVYVEPAKDSTTAHEVDLAVLKTRIEEALKGRKSIHFQIVSKPEDAELSVESNLIGFIWTDHDPVDMLVGVGAAAMDAAVIEDYASAEADMSVTDVRSKNVLWHDRVRASITKKPMSRAESIPLVTELLAKSFMKESFSKKR